ncbi:MAG: GntR family transcriptional regulator [Bacteroidales bacterium]|nr:GntR family transcriptional regulator [Bacteroidales bacterium]MBR5533071.1 GntR family transcriptional regulator [Bacteroidales bacterium]
MIQLGKYSTLKIVKELDFGMYLDGGEDYGEILLPTKYIPRGVKLGDEIEVFLYLDSEDRIIATTLRPYAQAGEFAYLEVASVNRVGAFLNWGLPKDLLVPFREQRSEMKQGYKYIVYIYADVESRRLVASAKLNKFLDNTPVEYEYNQEVDLLVTQKTDLGWKVIVNSRHSGMIYDNEIFVPIQKGDRIKGYVKHIRSDEKLDITLQKTGYDVEAMDALAKEIFEKLKASGGIIPLSDKSSAEEIAEIFGCSKKSYKKAIGSLYKAKLINITPQTIELIK